MTGEKGVFLLFHFLRFDIRIQVGFRFVLLDSNVVIGSSVSDKGLSE